MDSTQQEAASIRKRAYDARISVNALLKKAGVSGTTLWRWEKGKGVAHPVTLAKIKDALALVEADAPPRKCGVCGDMVRGSCNNFGCPL